MSQQSTRTILEKAGQKAGGTGGRSAEDKHKQRECSLLSLSTGAEKTTYVGAVWRPVQSKDISHLYHCSPESSSFSETLRPTASKDEKKNKEYSTEVMSI